MILWLKIEFARRAPFSDFDIRGFVSTDGNVAGRQIWQTGEQIAHRRFGCITAVLKRGLLLFKSGDLRFFCFSLVTFARLHQGANLFAHNVSLAVDGVGLAYDTAPFGVELDKFIEYVGGKIAIAERGSHRIQILAYKI